MATMRLAQPRFRPCSYDVAGICSGLLASGLQGLPAPHLASGGSRPRPAVDDVLADTL